MLRIRWAEDNTLLFGQEQGAPCIHRVSADGGAPALVIPAKGHEEPHGPQLLPDGRHVLFTIATGTGETRWDSAQIVVQSLDTGERKTIVSGGTDARFLPSGHLVYGLRNVLYVVPFDPRLFSLTGVPVPVVQGVRASGGLSGSMQFSVSNTGSLVYIERAATEESGAQLALVDRQGKVERLMLPQREYDTPRLAPDGARLALTLAP